MKTRTDEELIAAARKRAKAIRGALKSRGNRDGAPGLLDALADRLGALIYSSLEDADLDGLDR